MVRKTALAVISYIIKLLSDIVVLLKIVIVLRIPCTPVSLLSTYTHVLILKRQVILDGFNFVRTKHYKGLCGMKYIVFVCCILADRSSIAQ